MALKGRLTKEQFGLTMPVRSAAFVEKPPYWRRRSLHGDPASRRCGLSRAGPACSSPKRGVSQSIALMAGREGYGFPKKIGDINFVQHEDLVGMFCERPQGLRLFGGVFRGIRPLEPVPMRSVIKGITLRVILSPKPDERYSIVELVMGELEIVPKEVLVGEGNCSYSGLSELDPWHQLPVRKNLGCTRTSLDINLKGAAIETL